MVVKGSRLMDSNAGIQPARFTRFEEFWPYYLGEHSKPETRALHLAGTTIAAVGLAAWFATSQKRYLALSLLGSYGPAWFGHTVFEHNGPATFDYPLWSLRADLLMYQKWLTGELDDAMAMAELKSKNAMLPPTIPI